MLLEDVPGTGKTTLIQMIAGLINDYCEVAGYTFHYENFGVDQISSYQGKSGQNCRQFITNVMDPRTIGFGTVDDIDQVAAKHLGPTYLNSLVLSWTNGVGTATLSPNNASSSSKTTKSESSASRKATNSPLVS